MGWPKMCGIKTASNAPSLINALDEEIILELRSQGVIGIRRLRPKNGKNNPNIRLTFFGKTPPTEIRAGFEDIKVEPRRHLHPSHAERRLGGVKEKRSSKTNRKKTATP